MQFNVHKEFQLNGVSFLNEKELILFSKTVSSSIFLFLSDFLNDSDSIQIQTSGSTGKPKLIRIRKEYMINSAKATGEFFNLKEGINALLCMNPEFVAGKMMLVRAMLIGWKIDVVEPSLNPLKGVEKVYDFSAMVPLQVYNSIGELDKVKKLIVGGGVVSNELNTKLQNLSTQVFATYGMTETVTHIAVKRLNCSNENADNYVVLPEIKISKDSRGCLVIDAPYISNGKVITNDLVNVISANEFQWLGRYDSIINSGGIKLIPEVIEDKLSEIISQRFFIAGIHDEQLGEKVVLVIENSLVTERSRSDQRDIILNEVKNLSTLSKYEIPKEIYFVEKFIETETKKIQRKKTLELIF